VSITAGETIRKGMGRQRETYGEDRIDACSSVVRIDQRSGAILKKMTGNTEDNRENTTK